MDPVFGWHDWTCIVFEWHYRCVWMTLQMCLNDMMWQRCLNKVIQHYILTNVVWMICFHRHCPWMTWPDGYCIWIMWLGTYCGWMVWHDSYMMWQSLCLNCDSYCVWMTSQLLCLNDSYCVWHDSYCVWMMSVTVFEWHNSYCVWMMWQLLCLNDMTITVFEWCDLPSLHVPALSETDTQGNLNFNHIGNKKPIMVSTGKLSACLAAWLINPLCQWSVSPLAYCLPACLWAHTLVSVVKSDLLPVLFILTPFSLHLASHWWADHFIITFHFHFIWLPTDRQTISW